MKVGEKQKKKIVEIMRGGGAVLGFLFGSVVRGTAGPMSDIDFAVAFPRHIGEDERYDKVEDIRNALEHLYGVDKVDVVDLNRLRHPVLMHEIVLDEGKLLFNDDRDFKNHLSLKALRDFEDTRPIRNIRDAALEHLFE